jgi:glycosyltransferase involved in cell wall biosynthesis
MGLAAQRTSPAPTPFYLATINWKDQHVKIAIDARELSTSTGRYVERLLHYLQRVDSQHDYLVLLKPSDIPKWRPSNPRFTVVVCPHKEFTFDEQFGLRKQLKKLNADLVHFTMTQQPIYYYGKAITTVHDLTTARFRNPDKNWFVFKIKQMVYRVVIIWVAHKSKLVITPSNYVKKDLAKFTRINPNKIVVTHESADKISVPAKQIDKLAGKQFIMYVGRPTPHKNLNRLVDAFKITLKDRPELKLVLAGKIDPNYERVKKRVEKAGITNSIVFTDFINEGELRWLYEHSAAYVFPSLSEGFGLPGLEAMIHGAPVVSSDATCLPEVYGDAAHYFDPRDVRDMAAKISDVLTDSKLRQDLIKKGTAQAAKYSWQRMAEQTLEIYSKFGT